VVHTSPATLFSRPAKRAGQCATRRGRGVDSPARELPRLGVERERDVFAGEVHRHIIRRRQEHGAAFDALVAETRKRFGAPAEGG
jgi:hypothetical protein